MGDNDLESRASEALAKLSEAVDVMDKSKAEQTDRYITAKAEQERIAADLNVLMAEKQQKDRDEETAKAKAELDDLIRGIRSTSKAHLLGSPGGSHESPQMGSFLKAVYLAKSSDYAQQTAAKALLGELGVSFMTPEEAGSKATLGSTDATGGYIIPNNLVESIMKPKTAANIYNGLCTVIRDVRGGGVDQPIRLAGPNRMVVAAWGDTKENVNLVYNNYTATLYTIARIHDVAAQFIRQSEGAAQTDVLGELGRAAALGEAYYILSGSGSSEPYGLLTALATNPLYTTSHTAVNTTVAGSMAAAIAKAAGALAGRSRFPEAAVCNAVDYWTALAQGTDTAGFFVAPSGAGSSVFPNPNGGSQVFAWGIPLYPDVNMTSDKLVVGEWSALKVYYGMGFRIDSSDVAGDRWDKNLVGFRGEEEIGLDARAAVFTGAFQLISDAVA
jgi:HK97 family phage major capsid protein